MRFGPPGFLSGHAPMAPRCQGDMDGPTNEGTTTIIHLLSKKVNAANPRFLPQHSLIPGFLWSEGCEKQYLLLFLFIGMVLLIKRGY